MPLSTFLDGRSYTQLRGLAWLSLSDTATYLTLGGSSDAGGGYTSTWGTAGTAIPCRIDPLLGGEQQAAGRISDRSTHLITLPPGQAATVEGRFAIAGRGTFAVTAVRDRTREWTRPVEVVQV